MGQPFAIPYRTFVDGDLPRPYLVMEVTGLNGTSMRIYGIVDSGADQTSLPFEYASIFGYDETTLSQRQFRQVEGTGTSYVATTPCTAVVMEIPGTTVSLSPQFIKGSQIVLWGRLDFMRSFHVTVRESEQIFVIEPA